ncbi:MAG: serine--tRNA ligase [Cytophagales bacterium]|nr:serine--tRNA ligase [Cytophagales bacterium]MDW8385180.1 serine--tRNA ligase [Flammeovirgaceae bacterium]
MLTLSIFRENKDKVIRGLHKKHVKNPEEIVEQVLLLDRQRRSLQAERDETQNQMNALSKEIGNLMKSGNVEEAEKAKMRSSSLKEKVKELTEQTENLEQELTQLLYTIPNLPHESVPEGQSAEDNVIVQEGGTIPSLPENALAHWDLAHQYNILDFELGNKVTGAGFPFYKGKGAKLVRALINFFLEEAEKAGYTEIQAPHIVNETSGYGTGQLPDKEGQMYKIHQTDLYLIPTAEVPLTNMYRDIILEEKDFPIKLAGYTPCFRAEAGSWGAHVRGLNRLHQFDKVEIVRIERPENSYDVLEEMCAHVQSLLEKLELPYRRIKLCGGDISFNAALCYDFEVFSAGQKKWLEVSSVSNFESFQANRLKLRYRTKEGKIQLAHTLNGSALAIPRVLSALLENNQTPHGILIPKVLQPYCRFDKID